VAQPADLREQLALRNARLRLVPGDETPPPEAVVEQVQHWQEHLQEAAETIRWSDATIEQLAAALESSERDRVLELVRETRARAFAVMTQLNPDQAWFWTEEWQAGEREADADIAAGRLTRFETDEQMFAAFEARMKHADA